MTAVKCSNDKQIKPYINGCGNFEHLHINTIQVKVLKLTVKEPWFTLMAKGEKVIEFRTPSKWIKSRLYDKNGESRHYDYVSITNGYGKDRPAFLARYEGFGTGYNNEYVFSDGSRLTPQAEDFALFLGEITMSINIKKEEHGK